MHRFVIPSWLTLALGTALCAAQDSPEETNAPPQPATPAFSSTDVEFFERRIRPLLVKHCYECHSGEAETLQGGLRLDSRAGLLKGGDLGPALIPGDAKRSLLIEAVHYDGENVQMPPSGRLPDDEIADLVSWVTRGAPFPGSSDVTLASDQTIDFEEARNFWSFQPVRRHELPEVRDADWPQQRMDRFVLARLEQDGLRPSPPAERGTLLRRISFDLVGLPPTPEEVQAFENDATPDAYARVVDRLLDSPHYGERWGRFWLDVARYSDTTAKWLYSLNRAYLYRDWVVQALNDDVPYDEFVTRQLATDLMPSTGPEDVPALGFLGLSPTYWKELKLAPNVIQTIVAEEWDERIDAVTRGFLGLTVSCARCHDHKFDPIATEDYYALAGVFASIRLASRPMIDDDMFAAAKAAREEVAQLERDLKSLSMDSASAESADHEQKMAHIEARIAKIKQTTPHYDAPQAHGVVEASLYVQPDGEHRTKLEYRMGEPRDVPVFVRGNPAHAGEPVPRRFLRLFSPDGPVLFQQGSGRRELAAALFEQSGDLAARVIVNRVWKQHFGRGIVETPSNFGTQGSPPSHPELLDDLSARFVESGWSLKWLHREIVTSATYRQSSAYDPQSAAIDPANRLLWRMNRRRLEIEAWRDALLAVSGALDLQMGGPAQDLGEATNLRRTLYGTVNRREIDDMLRLNDFPDPGSHSPARETTTTPLQQLFVMNSPFVQQQATALAQQLRGESADGRPFPEQITMAYRLLYSRQPSEEEIRWAEEFLAGDSADPESVAQRWRQYAQVLIAGNEFLFLD